MFDAGGNRALDPIAGVGKQSRLKPKDRALLERMLIAGPRAYGFADGVWTLRRVRELIAERLGMEFSISHVHRLMHALGFSAQKPQVRAIERDESAIAHFRRHQWSLVKKRPRKQAKRSR